MAGAEPSFGVNPEKIAWFARGAIDDHTRAYDAIIAHTAGRTKLAKG